MDFLDKMLFVDITVDNTIWLLKPVTPSVYTAVTNPYPVVLVAVGAQWPWPWTRSYSMHIEECLQLTQTGYNSCLLEYSSTGSSCSSFFFIGRCLSCRFALYWNTWAEILTLGETRSTSLTWRILFLACEALVCSIPSREAGVVLAVECLEDLQSRSTYCCVRLQSR